MVPIFIVSNQKNASAYSVKLLESEISASSPILKYSIKGISSIDIPVISYNGVDYSMHKIAESIYESEKLFLVETSTKVTLRIGDFKQTDVLTIKTGVDEDDLFGGFFDYASRNISKVEEPIRSHGNIQRPYIYKQFICGSQPTSFVKRFYPKTFHK